MTIDLSQISAGELGEGTWFSSLLLAAIQQRFTGAFLVETENGPATAWFEDGQPIHARGRGFAEFFLGQILLDQGRCRRDQLDMAVEAQKSRPDALLGALLVRDGVDPGEVRRAVQAQTQSRLGTLMQLTEGRWQAAAGSDPKIKEVAVPLDGWETFFNLMQTRTSSKEREHQADALLGYAVQLRPGGLPQRAWSSEERKMLKYLEKPRKPEQLEKAFRQRRFVRGFLRTLLMMERLEVVAVYHAKPIVKTTHLYNTMSLPTMPASGSLNTTDVNGATATASGRSNTKPPAKPKKSHPLMREIRKFHEDMEDKSFFSILGVDEKTDPAEVRRKYLELVKKFHSDKWPAEIDRDSPIAEKAEEISARLNEAYETLSDPDRRQEYIDFLNDDRIKGDYRKAAQLRDADLKAKKGLTFLRKHQYGSARELFRFAHQTDLTNGLYEAYLAWSMYADPSYRTPQVAEDAYQMLRSAADKEKDEWVVYWYLGQVLKARGKLKEAHKQFKKVNRLNPTHAEAQSEIRHLKRRMDNEDKKKGGLGKFFDFFKKDDDDDK